MDIGSLDMIKGLLITATVLLTISPADAAVVTQFLDYDLQTTTSGLARGNLNVDSQQIRLAPFDSSLGELDRVRVSLPAGTLVFSGTSGNNGFDLIGGLIPVPYLITPTVSIGIAGLIDYFTINPDMDSLYSIPATGNSSPIGLLGGYSLGIRIDEDSDQLGGDRLLNNYSVTGVPVSVPLVSGRRSDFLDSTISSDLLLFSLGVKFNSTAVAPFRTSTVLKTRFSGTMQVEYSYTPLSEPVAAVPVPAALYLFGTALIGIIGFGKRLESSRNSLEPKVDRDD